MAEVLVGDETGSVLLRAKNEQGVRLGSLHQSVCATLSPGDAEHTCSRRLASRPRHPPTHARTRDAVELAQPGAYLSLTNAKVEINRGSIRLVVDKWGKVEHAEGQSFKPRVRKPRVGVRCRLLWGQLRPHLWGAHHGALRGRGLKARSAAHALPVPRADGLQHVAGRV